MGRIYTDDPATNAIIERELRYGQTIWVEVWAACIIIGIGYLLLQDSVIFAAPSFSVIRTFVDETTAGWIGLTIGVFRLVALKINGTFRRSPIIRMIGSCGGFFFFAAFAAGLYLNSASTGIVTYSFLALAELHALGRAAADAFTLDSFGERARRRTVESQ